MKASILKKSLIYSILLSLLLPTISLFSSCAATPKKRDKTWFEYFDTFSTLTVYTESEEQFNTYASLCQSMLREYHQMLDIYNEYEGIVNLKQINESKEPCAVDPRLGEFLQFGKEIHEMTNGYTNIAMGSVLSLWHTARETKTLPSHEALLEANGHVNINDLSISEDHTTVQVLDPELRIDAGALGKGFVAEKIKQALRNHGCTSFLLNLGGNTVAHGSKPDGTPWLVGIENPTSGDGFDGSVKLSDFSLVTSGSYQRYFTVDGRDYHHVIHKDTLYPETYCTSVSVLYHDSALADALSTALFCMSVEDGMKLLAQTEDAEALWLFPDGSVRMTDGFTNHVQTENQ